MIHITKFMFYFYLQVYIFVHALLKIKRLVSSMEIELFEFNKINIKYTYKNNHTCK
jgi:hypothetical protein